MIRAALVPILALAGAGYAAWVVAQGSQPPKVAPPVAPPARAPFAAYIAGAGLVEAQGQNVAIASPLARLVEKVLVQVGDDVDAGAPLFRLDGRDLAAEREIRGSAVLAAKARLDRLLASPRPEELPPAEARVKEAEAALADARRQVELWEKVSDARAVSIEDLDRKRYAAQAAAARVEELKAARDLLKAGAWKPDVDVARADLAGAEAQAKAVDTEIDRLTVRAPTDGTVLQVNVRAGEFAPAGPTLTPLLLFGALKRFHVRVDVDENDAWRFEKGSKAAAFVRGNRELRADLAFVRVEPYVLPKRSLTGESTERVDTRVLQVIYSFDRAALPVFVGQQMDVYIEAKPMIGSGK
ncbi:MAG TPA: efflux RND transporter periplasmic adaptor subunit [Planctomycetota bacterium]